MSRFYLQVTSSRFLGPIVQALIWMGSAVPDSDNRGRPGARYRVLQEAKNCPLSVSPVQEMHKMHRNREIACTIPTQPKTCHLSLNKSEISKNPLTRSG